MNGANSVLFCNGFGWDFKLYLLGHSGEGADELCSGSDANLVDNMPVLTTGCWVNFLRAWTIVQHLCGSRIQLFLFVNFALVSKPTPLTPSVVEAHSALRGPHCLASDLKHLSPTQND